MANQTGQPRDRHCECANTVWEKYGAIAFFVFHFFPKNIQKIVFNGKSDWRTTRQTLHYAAIPIEKWKLENQARYLPRLPFF